MKKAILLLATLYPVAISYAQELKGIVKGFLQDSIVSQPMAGATISVASVKDSPSGSISLSSNNGYFEIKRLNDGSYYVIISYKGFETIKKSFSISQEHYIVELGIVKMHRVYETLSEVIVKHDAPAKRKGDTLVFNANAFKTKNDGTVEDLLKKLPGVQVDKAGNVKTQGENVQKIYVDGKEFFSDDPKLATKNLMAEMVDQVEVFNDMSDQAKFSGIDDGSRTKAINLKLKKKKNGLLGKAYAGIGTANRYNVGITGIYSKGASQLSLVVAKNNFNKIDYTGSNILDSRGRDNEATGYGGNGLTSTSSIGLNYRDTWSKRLDLNGSYFFSQANTTNTRKSSRKAFFADSTILTTRQTDYNYINNNHRLNLKIIYTVDSLNSIIYTISFNARNSRSSSSDTLSDYIDNTTSPYKGSDSRTMNSNNRQGYNWINNLTWRRRFNRPGRTISASLSGISNTSETNGYSAINARFYNSNALSYRQKQVDYKTNYTNQTHNSTVALSYTEPVGKSSILEFNYSYNRNRNTSDRKTYTYNTITKQYDEPEDTLTNNFQQVIQYNRFGANFRTIEKKYNYQLGFAIQQSLSVSNNLSKKINLTQHYANLFPTASFSYQLTKSKSLRLNYRGYSNQPSITQLQDITDISTYPYMRKGNPALKQEFMHNLLLAYNFFNISKLRNMFAYIVYNNTHNKIVNAIQQKDGEQIFMPVNIKGSYNVSGTISFGFPIKKLKGMNLSTNTRIGYSQNATLINNAKNYVKNLLLAEEVAISFNYDEMLDINLNAAINYNSVKHTIQYDPGSSYFTHNYSFDISYTFADGFILSTLLDYTGYTGTISDVDQNYFTWNASLAKKLLKNKRGALTLSIYDLLNQNSSVSRNIYDNFIEDVQNTTQRRFVLLTFTYNLNSMNRKNDREHSALSASQ